MPLGLPPIGVSLARPDFPSPILSRQHPSLIEILRDRSGRMPVPQSARGLCALRAAARTAATTRTRGAAWSAAALSRFHGPTLRSPQTSNHPAHRPTIPRFPGGQLRNAPRCGWSSRRTCRGRTLTRVSQAAGFQPKTSAGLPGNGSANRAFPYVTSPNFGFGRSTAATASVPASPPPSGGPTIAACLNCLKTLM